MHFQRLQLFLEAFLSATVLAVLLTPLAMKLGVWLGIIDAPRGRKQHESPTPSTGGLAVFAAFHITLGSFAAYILPGLLPSTNALTSWWVNVLIVTSIVLVLGIVDDKFEISPLAKLGGQVIAAVVAWLLGARVQSVIGFEILPALDIALTVFLIVAIMNAYNLIDGMDGIAGGLGAISALGLAGLHVMTLQWPIVVACLALCGACLGFLRYNFHPARVFLGDTGSMLIGCLLVLFVLSSQHRQAAFATLLFPILALGVPLIDTCLAIWRRSVRKRMSEGTRVSEGDRDHLHHRLARKGLTQTRVAWLLYSLQAAIIGAGLLMIASKNLQVTIFVIAFFTGTFVLLKYLASLELSDSGRLIVDGIRRPSARKLIGSLLPGIDVAVLCSGVVALHFLGINIRASETTLRHTLIEILPSLAGIPIILIRLTGFYKPKWSRARAADYLYLYIVLCVGCIVGASIAQLSLELPTHELIIFGLAFMSLVIPPMLGLRAFPRLVQDMLHLHERHHREADIDRPHVLAYGAGYGFTLLVRSESFAQSSDRLTYHLVGLIDDSPNLLNWRIHGHRVLGALEDIPAIVSKHDVQEILVTTELPPERRDRLVQIAKKHRLRVSYWFLNTAIWCDYAPDEAGITFQPKLVPGDQTEHGLHDGHAT